MAVPGSGPELPRLPSAPVYERPAPTENAPGQIPTHLYDPAFYNRPLKRRRSRRTVVSLVAVAIVVGGGAVAAVVWGATSIAKERKFPTVTASPDYRSSIIQETSRGIDQQPDYIATFRGDATERVVSVDIDTADLESWTGNDTHWFSNDAGGWTRIPNTPADVEQHNSILMMIDGLTIDEVLPPDARPYVEVIDVDREELLGDEVRKFTTHVDVIEMGRENPRAAQRFEEFWGVGATADDDPNPATADLPIGIIIWVTDEGIVHKVESKSDIDDSFFQVVFVNSSTSDEYSPELPTDFAIRE